VQCISVPSLPTTTPQYLELNEEARKELYKHRYEGTILVLLEFHLSASGSRVYNADCGEAGTLPGSYDKLPLRFLEEINQPTGGPRCDSRSGLFDFAAGIYTLGFCFEGQPA
jgi:hypothetical protein